MNLEMYGVKFNDKKIFHAVRRSVESAMIEGFKPTMESIQNIKNLLEGNLTVKKHAEEYKKREQEITSKELSL